MTVDSGAAESVKDVLPCQVAVGVLYVTANGSRLDNYGEKVRFRGGGIKGTNSITFSSYGRG